MGKAIEISLNRGTRRRVVDDLLYDTDNSTEIAR
jgi:hypothetical protein